ncbi:hypothetical protein CAEBREN_04948 [Caenorhabditis brenneri]|uniref:Uncharacterized protein n=1 Tax=Caenorhabditis brenneri TaxID=135651 RepID=G0MD05_CAEBE|nr:hypothetical protein CAEBREN_04948 [Caenorhabditis brenneri]
MAIRTPEEQEAYNQAARKLVEYEAKLDDCIVRDQVKRAQIRTSILIDMMPMPPRRGGRKESSKKQPIKKVSPAAIQKSRSAGSVENKTADVRSIEEKVANLTEISNCIRAGSKKEVKKPAPMMARCIRHARHSTSELGKLVSEIKGGMKMEE